MNFDRTWMHDEPINDAFGRFLWALGTVMAKPPSASYLSIIKDCFDISVKHVQRQYPRGMAYSILGMSDYLKQFPGASDIKRQLEMAADQLAAQYRENSLAEWHWFEDSMTYDNAVLPHALFVAGMALENDKYRKLAQQSCEFLLEKTYDGDHFSFVGNRGWYERGQTKALFDQQPIEAAGTALMLRSAYDATQDSRFLTLQRKAFEWFLGENAIHVPLYDVRSKGCYDGLIPTGVNLNQGAESLVSFLMALLSIIESYAVIDKIKGGKEISLKQAKPTEQKPDAAQPIKSISPKRSSKKTPVQKPA
jgi:hypothetical protein